MTFEEEIQDLMYLKQEGGYWDFKREWHTKKDDLLHDIICMANNLEDRDAYIIIGVDESDDYRIHDVTSDINRRSTQKLVDFLKDKKFAGDVRPIVKVESIEFPVGTIDVIVIKNSNSTPFYLKEVKGELRANHIYTRVQDTNTPKNSSADIGHIEWLWKKRLGLHLTPLERVEYYLSQPEDWRNGPYGEDEKYHKLFPEFTLTYKWREGHDKNPAMYVFTQRNSEEHHWLDIRIKYHQTLLMEIQGVSLDSGQFVTPCPYRDGFSFEDSRKDITFYYMDKNSINYELSDFLSKHDFTVEGESAKDRFFEVVLVFENENEREDFKSYAQSNWDKREAYKLARNIPSFPDKYKANYEQSYRNGLILKCMLEEFRQYKK